MREIEGTYFDPTEDGFTPVTPGIYPAHVIAFDMKDSGRNGEPFANNSKVFNLTFKIADEASKIEVDKIALNGNGTYTTVTDGNGKTVKIKATNAVGKKYNSQGVWLTPKTGKDEGWKNRNYNKFFTALGIEFPDKDGKLKLAQVEEGDVIGRPALVRLAEEKYMNNEGEEKTSMKVFDAYDWAEGRRISQDELDEADLPF